MKSIKAISLFLIIICTSGLLNSCVQNNKKSDSAKVNKSEYLHGSENLPPVRAITHGPKFHWFGYYDKLEFDPTGRYVLGMEVDFEHRSPRPDDVIRIGIVDLQDKNRWIELGESRAWGWQQGCMLQWRPGSATEVLWNDRQDGRYVCHILDIKTKKKRTIPFAIYTVSPDGCTALSVDFERINDMRPGYGYVGLPDPNKNVLAPKDAGIYRVNLDTGEGELIISIDQAAKIPFPHADLSEGKHYFNHLLFNTDGSRFIFLHRWRIKGQETFGTRMLTASAEGKDINIVDDNGNTSHFIWRDPFHILAWAGKSLYGDKFYLFKDGTREVKVVGEDVMPENGHCSYLPGNEWILNDTYPDDKRLQNVYLYHVKTERRMPLGYFYLPPEYKGEWRCDTHPRFSPDGKSVVIDSPHEGNGRQLYLIDISGIVSNINRE